MASDAEMASYIADMLNPLGEVRIKRMFGEYCFYVNEKPVGFLCDNEVLVKTNAEMRTLYPEMPQKSGQSDVADGQPGRSRSRRTILRYCGKDAPGTQTEEAESVKEARKNTKVSGRRRVAVE